MKVAIVLLVCFAALAAAAPPTPPNGKSTWEDWRNDHKEPTAKLKAAEWTDNTGLATSYVISDAGSGGTRLLIGLEGLGEMNIGGFAKVVTPDSASTSNPKDALVLKAFKELISQYPKIRFVAIGATAGARNDMWKDANTDIVLRMNGICSALQTHVNSLTAPSGWTAPTWACKSAILQGATEGFFGWYDGWRQGNNAGGPKPSPYCFMEFGGMSTQMAVSDASLTATANAAGKLVSKVGGGKDDINVAIISGFQLGFNPIGMDELNTSGSSKARAVLKDCDIYNKGTETAPGVFTPGTGFTFTKCEAAAKAFLDKDADLATCVTTYAADFKSKCSGRGKTIFVHDKAPWTDTGAFPNGPADLQTADLATHADCQAAPGSQPSDPQKRMPWFRCARLIQWKYFLEKVFGTDAVTNQLTFSTTGDNEWFKGFLYIMKANKFDLDLLEALFTNAANNADPKPIQSDVGHAKSDCAVISGNNSWPTGSRTRGLRLHARGGRRMARISGLRLKF